MPFISAKEVFDFGPGKFGGTRRVEAATKRREGRRSCAPSSPLRPRLGVIFGDPAILDGRM